MLASVRESVTITAAAGDRAAHRAVDAVEQVAQDTAGKALGTIDRLGEKVKKIEFSLFPHAELGHRLLWPSLMTSVALILYEYSSWKANRVREQQLHSEVIQMQIENFANTFTHDPFNQPSASVPSSRRYEVMLRKNQETEHDIVAFVPSIFSFSFLVSTKWASVLGAIWCLGRWLYHHGYRMMPWLEGPGYTTSMITQAILLVGSFLAAARLAAKNPPF